MSDDTTKPIQVYDPVRDLENRVRSLEVRVLKLDDDRVFCIKHLDKRGKVFNGCAVTVGNDICCYCGNLV
tara:strand:- start:274 stop:483 length:210 start_codon:yes stop_codon:yes gene_type:complete